MKYLTKSDVLLPPICNLLGYKIDDKIVSPICCAMALILNQIIDISKTDNKVLNIVLKSR